MKACWATVPIQHSAMLAALDSMGFQLHHAHKEDRYIMMNVWLVDGPNKLPHFATHSIGVGAFVVNDQDQVLVIKEKKFGQYEPMWKLPGGAADTREDIPDTARREVFEETGVHCEFKGVMAFRQLHGFRHGHSDLYYVCRMKALSTQINMCRDELSVCEWRPMEEYLASLREGSMNQFIARIGIAGTSAPLGVGGEWVHTTFRDTFRDKERRYNIFHQPLV